MKLDRRSFLQFSGFTLAGAMLGAGTRKWVLPYEKPYYATDGVEEWSTSICRQCPAACGIRIRKMDGWPVSIEGNPDCPISRGKLCPRGLSGLQALYNPSRVLSPLHRANRQDPSSWKKTTWAEAIQTVGSQLKMIRQKGNAHRVVACIENTGGMQNEYVRRFFQVFGTNNIVDYSGLRDPAAAAGIFYTCGQKAEPVYDLKNAHFVLSVGTPLLEGWLSPTLVHRWFGEFRQGRERRGKFVQVEDRLSPTAAKADEWIPLPSGTEADFLLGLASVLILEGLYDHDFIQQHCAGFENWTDERGEEHQGFQDLILDHYSLDRLAEVTGIPSVTFLRLARELALQRPSLVIAEKMDATAGLKTLWAAQCLNALLGNIGSPGGVLIPRPNLEINLGNLALDETAKKSRSQVRLDGTAAHEPGLLPLSVAALTQALLTESPYSIDAIFYFPGPSLPYLSTHEKIQPKLSKVPLIVSFSPYLDEKSADADWILPDAAPLEKWLDVVPQSPEGVSVHALAGPARQPFLDVKDTVAVLHLLAKQIGGTVEESLPWANSQELLQAGARDIYNAQRGQIYTTEFAGEWLSQMEQGGWWAPQHPDFAHFWEDLVQKGGWWDPLYRYQEWKRTFSFPSGKFEFLSAELQKLVTEPEIFWTPSHAEKSDDSMALVRAVPVFSLDHVSFMLQPFLLEITDQFQRRQWECLAEINPETAQRLQLHDGERIRIWGKEGSFTIRIVLYAGVIPGHLNVIGVRGNDPKSVWTTGFGTQLSGWPGSSDPYLKIPLNKRVPFRIQKV